MKSNMNSLTTKILFFLVFSILHNFTTSDEIQDCINDLEELYVYSNRPQKTFKIAMAALNTTLVSSITESMEVEDLYGYFDSYNDYVSKTIGDETIMAEHSEVLVYTNLLKDVKELKSMTEKIKNEGSSSSIYTKMLEMFNTKWMGFPINTDDGPSIEMSYFDQSRPQNHRSLAQKQVDLMGYFQSFADQITAFGVPVDRLVQSPKIFCENHPNYVQCSNALCRMLNRRDAMDNMTGSQALRHCYLNYTYLDFNNINQIDNYIMMKYFSQLLRAATTIGNSIRRSDNSDHPSIFLTVNEYCRTTVQNRG